MTLLNWMQTELNMYHICADSELDIPTICIHMIQWIGVAVRSKSCHHPLCRKHASKWRRSRHLASLLECYLGTTAAINEMHPLVDNFR